MSVQLGDYGFKIVINVKNSAGAARDLTGATNLQIKLRADASPAIKTFTGVAEDLAQGAISYTVEQGDIDALGQWEGQALFTLSGEPGYSQWVDLFDVVTSDESALKIVQLFCTVADLVADKQSPGVDEVRMMQAIREASDWMQKNIGWFIPVTLTKRFTGKHWSILKIGAGLLAITSISNDGVTLTSSDYILKPDNGFWAHGPYVKLIIDPDATLISRWSCERDGIVILGLWGKYNKSATIDATVQETTLQNETQATLKVSNGGLISPGMILLLGSEQQAVVGWGSPTDSVTALNMASGITASESDAVITVDNASLINVGEIIRMEFEQCKVVDRRVSSNQLSVIRGWNGTQRTTHANDTAVDVYRTVNVERGVNGTIATAHSNGTQLARYMVPDDIQLLAKEIAQLSVSKALSGYQGRTGTDEAGVVFYNDIFPRFDIERIKRNYKIPRLD